MTKHTRGPWGPITDEFGNCERGIEYPDDRDHYLAVVQCGDPDELLANARLIAAAPELLAVLREVFSHDDDGPVWADSTIAKARAVIAKATGGVQL